MLVSVVIPTYNRRHLIGGAVKSALAQQDVDVEVVVVDDGSTDDTVGWLASEFAGRPVRVLANRGRKGPAGGRNTGMRAATGELVALLDSDDTYLLGHLAAAVDAFERFPELGLVFGRASYERNGQPDDYMGPLFERKLVSAPATHRDDGLIVFGPDFFDHLLQYGCWFNLSTVVMRHELAQVGMNESLRVAEDYEFWVRLAQRNRFACLLRPQIRYLLHDDNISFETTGTAAENAPSLLAAYQCLAELPSLSSRQRRLLKAKRAEIMGDWAWRCRQQGRWRDAAMLYMKSLPLGRRSQHLRGLLAVCAEATGLRR